jgi:selenocysteine lyase/cysteine desulfurase
MAFYGLPLKTGDRILTHESEYVSNYLALLQRARSRGLEIDVVPSDSLGQIDLQAMEELIGPRTRLVMLTHVPTQGGLVNPAEAVGKIAARHGLIYMLDACQSAGQMELNVSRIGCHVLSGTGRKFLRGPRGTGFLYVCDDMIAKIEPPFIDLRSAEWTTSNTYKLVPDATRFENWESFVAGRIGLAHAVQYARRIGLDDIEESILRLARQLRDGLSALPKVTVHDRGKRQCGIVTFLKDGLAPYDMQQRLRDAGINVSVSTRNSAQLDFGSRGLNSLVRASVHYYNTENEVDRFVETIRKLQ